MRHIHKILQITSSHTGKKKEKKKRYHFYGMSVRKLAVRKVSLPIWHIKS